jgi:MarR family transcriptional regulator, lower aerobic nicotinate degradation pathway regulator
VEDAGRIGPALSVLDVATALGRAHRAAEAAADATLRCVAISAAQMRVLEALEQLGRSPWTVGEVARVLDLHRTTVSKIVDALEGRGLVERSADDVDRRRTTVALTAGGRARVEQARRVLDGRDLDA